MTVNVSEAGAAVVTGTEGFSVSAASTAVVTGVASGLSVHLAGAFVVVAAPHLAVAEAGAFIIVEEPVPPVPVPTDELYAGSPDPEADQAFVVPAGITSIDFKLWGASGGSGDGYSPAGTIITGGGAFVGGTLAVNPGDTLTVRVGRGGKQAVYGLKSLGAGGWPDGAEGTYDRKHDAYQGGQGGSTQLLLNDVLKARAGGSPGSKGFPLGGSAVPATDTYLAPEVTSQVIETATSDAVAASSLAPVFTRPGWGVLNTGAAGAGNLGDDGLAWLRYYT